MKKVLIGSVIAIIIAGLIVTGVFAANWFWTGRAYPGHGWGGMMGGWRAPGIFGGWFNRDNTGIEPYGCTTNNGSSFYGGMMGGRGYGGMMGGYQGSFSNGDSDSCPYLNSNGGSTSGTRLTIDQAQANLEDYLANDPNLKLAEVMEFKNNFYGVVIEKVTGRGAMELLVDPYSGAVGPEFGPNMMWNEKYGHMGGWYSTSGNEMTLDEAKVKAQAALDKEVPGGIVEGMGIEFYGYFTFDYTIDGNIAGMLSVNTNGQTWIHTWHGAFIDEIELDE